MATVIDGINIIKMNEAIINTLIQKGVITRDEAEEILEYSKKEIED